MKPRASVSTLGDSGRWVSFTGAPVKDESGNILGAVGSARGFHRKKGGRQGISTLMKKIARAEWDTLLFLLRGDSVRGWPGAVRLSGRYFPSTCTTIWGPPGPTSSWGSSRPSWTTSQVMFAVLTMDPAMSHGQWLLVTLTAGVGGKHAFYRLRRRCGPHGYGPGNIYFRAPT